MMQEILLSFVGNRDPFVDPSAEDDPEAGPVLSLLRARSFSRVVLFCTGSRYIEKARSVQAAAAADGIVAKFNFVSIELESPIDYEEIFRELINSVDQFRETIAHAPHHLSVLLDPGTPQMQTAWFLLVVSGHIQASLLQGIPPRFAGGAYKIREVDLSHNLFPGITIAETGDQSASASERAADGKTVLTTDAGSAADDAADDAADGKASCRVTGPSDSTGGENGPGMSAPDGHDESRDPADPPGGTWIKSSQTRVIGESSRFVSVVDQALQVARYDISVLVRGETGTGKEVIARMVHEAGPRADQAFAAVNCAAISAGLVESELFGHEKGAFTGASAPRLGQFRAATGGTVFLDEVGDLPLDTQAKLLRVLENRTVQPVGSDQEETVDVRIIAATNRDLEQQILEGTFRRDLYERLAQVTVTIPPLRERPEDIPLLLRHFVAGWNSRYHESKGLSGESVQYLMEYPWPGNVRELQNTVASTCAMGNSSEIGPELLPPAVQRYFRADTAASPIAADIPTDGLDLKAVLHNTERGYFEEALRQTDGNAEQAARLLGLQGPAFRKAARERLGIEWRDRSAD